MDPFTHLSLKIYGELIHSHGSQVYRVNHSLTTFHVVNAHSIPFIEWEKHPFNEWEKVNSMNGKKAHSIIGATRGGGAGGPGPHGTTKIKVFIQKIKCFATLSAKFSYKFSPKSRVSPQNQGYCDFVCDFFLMNGK